MGSVLPTVKQGRKKWAWMDSNYRPWSCLEVPTPYMSFVIPCDSQEEIDHCWETYP